MTDQIPYQEASLTQRTQAVPGHPVGGLFYFDKLATIFEGQDSLMAKYCEIEAINGAHVVSSIDHGDIDSREVQLRLHELYGYLIRELSEAMQELKSKPWKNQDVEPTDISKFKEEMADALHFFVEMCITAGMGPHDLFSWYFNAWSKNRERQTSGY